jgi:hypothetical protein
MVASAALSCSGSLIVERPGCRFLAFSSTFRRGSLRPGHHGRNPDDVLALAEQNVVGLAVGRSPGAAYWRSFAPSLAST